MSLHVVNFIFPAVSYLQVHNFCALVDTNGEGVVVFGGHQDLLEGSAGALSTLGGFLDQDLLKSHDVAVRIFRCGKARESLKSKSAERAECFHSRGHSLLYPAARAAQWKLCALIG